MLRCSSSCDISYNGPDHQYGTGEVPPMLTRPTATARCSPGPTGWVCCLARPPAVGLPAQSLPGHRLPQNYVHHRETASTEFYEGKEGPNRPLWL